MRLLPCARTRPGRSWSRAVATLCVLVAAPVLGGVSTAAAAADVARPVTRPVVEAPLVGDDHPGVLERRRRDARDLAVQGLLEGRIAATTAGSVELPGVPFADTGQGDAPLTTPYAETALQGSDRVLSLLVDFGPGDYADRTWNGPVHGDMGSSDEGAEGYESLLFGSGPASLRSYLLDQSGGRYTIDGTVQDWVGVPYNAARYGVDACDGAECPDRVADFVSDAVDAFVADFYARDPAGDLAAFLAPYDQRDRYDGDADGDFTEPDGYLDHIVLVFAGGSQLDTADTDLMQSGFGSVAGDVVTGGPSRNPYGGHQLGASGIWVDAFTAVPEDVDLGTLVHTFGHDLGLPDLADDAGHAQIDSSVQFWSPMAGGSRLEVEGAAAVEGEPATPGHAATGGRRAGIARAMAEVGVPDLLAAEKIQLGWVDYDVVTGSTPQTVQLVDSSGTPVRRPDAGVELSVGTEAAVVPLGPLASTSRLATPAVGGQSFGSTVGPSSRAELVVPLDGTADRVTWRQWADVEPVFDTLRVEVSVDGAWADVAPVANGASEWTSRSAPLPAGARLLRFSYLTDQVATGAGVLLDDIRLGNAAPEGAEQGLPAGWSATGWAAIDGTSTSTAPGFYVAERRDLDGYDASLLAAPYVANPRRGTTAVDRFGYDGGVLVSFWDGRAADNAVSAHPGSGRLLVVDARPDPIATTSGAAAPLGLHPFDAAFGTSWLRGFAVDAYSVTAAGEIAAERVRVRAQPPVPTFDDTDPRYAAGSAGQPRLPGLGVRLTVQDEGASVTSIQLAGPLADSVATGSVSTP